MQNVAMKEFGSPSPLYYYNFYEIFPLMLRYVTGTDDLSKAGIDLVVKTPDNVGPFLGAASDVQNFCEAKYLNLLKFFGSIPVYFDLEHHLAHAYQAFLCSPFEEAAVMTVDGTGEKLQRLGFNSITTTLCKGSNNRINVLEEVLSPSSVGGMYTNITRHIGFEENHEGKTMALAAFGSDDFYRRNPDLICLLDRGRFGFHLNDQLNNLRLMERMLEYCPPRDSSADLTQEHCDLAWAAQRLCEDILLHSVRYLYQATGLKRLALAGGVGLNCVANAKILTETPIREIYIMPNAGDGGIAVGCALFGYHVLLGKNNRCPPLNDYLGRPYSEHEILTALRTTEGIRYRGSADISTEVAELIEKGKIVGWFQGGAEFGPRALGNRSVVADPRTQESKTRLDRDVKRREWFRPYAPSVLSEEGTNYFTLPHESPYMLLAASVRPKVAQSIQGVVHVDGTARVQSVKWETNQKYHGLIADFYRRTGIPMVLNTSFNSNEEPIVETPYDALHSLFQMRLDALAIGDYLVERECTRAGNPTLSP